MTQPQPHQQPLDAVAAIAQALARLADEPPLELHVDRCTAWALLCQLQLAARHPDNTGPTATLARDFGHLLQAAVARAEPLKTLAAQGWDPAYDCAP